MEEMEYPMTIEYPDLRSEVVAAVRMLASAREERFLIDSGPRADLDYCIHILFDDTYAMSNPRAAVGVILFENEVGDLESLRDAFSPLINDLGNVDDDAYLADPRWGKVQAAASNAAIQMRKNGKAEGAH